MTAQYGRPFWSVETKVMGKLRMTRGIRTEWPWYRLSEEYWRPGPVVVTSVGGMAAACISASITENDGAGYRLDRRQESEGHDALWTLALQLPFMQIRASASLWVMRR